MLIAWVAISVIAKAVQYLAEFVTDSRGPEWDGEKISYVVFIFLSFRLSVH